MSEELKRAYTIGDEVGRGRFGIVRRCASVATGELLAVKSVDKSRLSDDIDRLGAEYEAKLAGIAGEGNPGVVQVRDAFEDEKYLHVVMELFDGQDLFDWIRLRRGIPASESEAAAIVAQLAETLNGCHLRGVAHRDIKPENILVSSDGRVRLADFGSAAWIGGGPVSGVVGTPHYVAPEVVRGEEYGEKVDVWSLGVVMYALLSGGTLPFTGETVQDIFAALMRANLRFPTRIFSGVSMSAKDLMRRMICKDVSRRFSFDQVLRHPWITTGGVVGKNTEPTK